MHKAKHSGEKRCLAITTNDLAVSTSFSKHTSVSLYLWDHSKTSQRVIKTQVQITNMNCWRLNIMFPLTSNDFKEINGIPRVDGSPGSLGLL